MWKQVNFEVLVDLASVPVYPIALSFMPYNSFDMLFDTTPFTFILHELEHTHAKLNSRDHALLKQEPYRTFYGEEISDSGHFNIYRASYLIKNIKAGLYDGSLTDEQSKLAMALLAIMFHEKPLITYPSYQILLASLKELRSNESEYFPMLARLVASYVNLFESAFAWRPKIPTLFLSTKAC